MSDKDLTVLAECVDRRTGKRFRLGDIFDPVPTPEQAKRLIIAGCLPRNAYDVAMDADRAREVAEDDTLTQAQTNADAAAKAVTDARAALDVVTANDKATADDKAAAAKTLADAQAAAKAASVALKKLSK